MPRRRRQPVQDSSENEEPAAAEPAPAEPAAAEPAAAELDSLVSSAFAVFQSGLPSGAASRTAKLGAAAGSAQQPPTGGMLAELEASEVASAMQRTVLDGIERPAGKAGGSGRAKAGFFDFQPTEVTEAVRHDVEVIRMRTFINPKKHYKVCPRAESTHPLEHSAPLAGLTSRCAGLRPQVEPQAFPGGHGYRAGARVLQRRDGAQGAAARGAGRLEDGRKAAELREALVFFHSGDEELRREEEIQAAAEKAPPRVVSDLSACAPRRRRETPDLT